MKKEEDNWNCRCRGYPRTRQLNDELSGQSCPWAWCCRHRKPNWCPSSPTRREKAHDAQLPRNQRNKRGKKKMTVAWQASHSSVVSSLLLLGRACLPALSRAWRWREREARRVHGREKLEEATGERDCVLEATGERLSEWMTLSCLKKHKSVWAVLALLIGGEDRRCGPQFLLAAHHFLCTGYLKHSAPKIA
jgi:hypothetical protein